MQQEKVLSGLTEEELWQQVVRDLHSTEDFTDYRAILELKEKKILLDIFIDAGGGFEASSSSTKYQSTVINNSDFEFALHKEHFINTAGKFLGMQDLVIGYPEFDEKIIIKSNDEKRLKEVFKDEKVRSTLSSIDDFRFSLQKIDNDETEVDQNYSNLELVIDEAFTEPDKLENIFYSYVRILLLTSS